MKKNKTECRATVLENIEISETFYRIKLLFNGTGAKQFAGTLPGQFAEFDLSGISIPTETQIPENLCDVSKRAVLLRRPFSFADATMIDSDNATVDIVYCVLGAATLRMKTLKTGDTLSVIGPLGNGFDIRDDKKYALLIAGGMGAPPIQHVAKYIKTNCSQTESIAFVGARSIKHLPYRQINTAEISDEPGMGIAEFAEVGVKSIVSTDDGSVGIKGFVTESIKKWLSGNAPAGDDCIIYACGPEPMLQAVSKIAAENQIQCQVSLERMMACGIGLCQSCAVEHKTENQDTVYKLCCKDGPVFDATKVVW